MKYSRGIINDVLVKVDKCIFPKDFNLLDMKDDEEIPLILGRPFLTTIGVLIDVQQGKVTMRVKDEDVTFDALKAMDFPPKI